MGLRRVSTKSQSLIPSPALDALVRRVDEDRWLASRFAPVAARARLIALYAVNYEIARTAEVVREPSLGDIRLAWWRDAIADALAGNAPHQHEALTALGAAHKDAPFSAGLFTALIEARRADIDVAPFSSTAAFDAYIDATAGGLMRLAAEACAAPFEGDSAAFASKAAWVWGAAGLSRAEPVWRARGRNPWPSGETSATLGARIEAALVALRAMPTPAAAQFPAYGYVANAAAYVRRLRRDPPGLLSRQVRLVVAAARGRI